MTNSTSLNVEGITLVFGPHDPNIDDAVAKELRTTLLLEIPDYQWIVDVLKQLPGEWQKVTNVHSELAAFQGERYLQLLNDWVRNGAIPRDLFPLPNIIVTPLVVAIHLVQYMKLLTLLKPGIKPEDKLRETLKYETEVVGLCTGLLSAAAVASSATLAELQKHGAVAIRMAMAIGALVDAGNTKPWKSLAVGWTSQAAQDEMSKILQQFPNAYLSVRSEDRLATITVPQDEASEFAKQLKVAGLVFTEITLQGPFHCAKRLDHAKSLLRLFDSTPSFQFPAASQLAFSTRAADGGEYRIEDKLHHTASRAILTDLANWHKLFTALHSSTSRQALVAFGSQRFMPQWLTRKLGSRLLYASDIDLESGAYPAPLYALLDPGKQEAIAVVGMACHFPGGADLDEFWDTVCKGKSQHTEVPSHRVNFDYAAWRKNNTSRRWYGNFVQDHDAFDHKFFKKSPREMASTDPQHRLILQVAYQAVEQSGHFNKSGATKRVGCYVGIGVADHENNVACHPPTAYTATGNLKAFAAGKISHFFGWSGPGVTVDTACSSSGLAVHLASQAILNGECDAALAGGTSVMTSPEWYQNLDGASFLSSSGQCKAFDEAADGYCRGEGAGAVFLKKLSAAIEEGDQILGVIRASTVNQNENCSAITAPSVQSLSDVFTSVLRKARVDPKQISVVEAHGTGTQVGDRAEYDSVRNMLGGPGRAKALSLGSVKGLIGHLECASGIAALIKLLLMIYNGTIPPQASFQKLSSRLNALPSDNIDIPTCLLPWETNFKAALLNNYGASGSNASLVITQPNDITPPVSSAQVETSTVRYPFWFAGLDDRSLRAYAAKMVQFLRSRSKTDHRFTAANLSYQVAKQSNRSLGQALVLSSSSVEELETKLASFADAQGELSSASLTDSPRPVILCFGGQRSDFVGLDREVYDRFTVLRTHIDHCHEICLSLGHGGILPGIFERTPRGSIVELQTMQFALQYSCAKSWIDSGVEVAAVVGHSFGELTAMCISGVLSVRDTLKVVSERARIIEETWGPERGCMMAVDADLTMVENLLREVNTASPKETPVNIACFNGPRSFTLAGTATAMELLAERISTDQEFSSVKSKPLAVTHAFHSALVEPLIADLEKVGEEVIFREPVIALERATEDSRSGPYPSTLFASHMRDPVYFENAVQRLAHQYPSSIWLEAGSGSGITTMASRAVRTTGMSFQPVNITSSGAVQNLTDTTVNLWKGGLNTSFWGHVEHAPEHILLLLPPYQFERSRHWLERRKPQEKVTLPTYHLQASPNSLWTFMGYKDEGRSQAQFQINTTSEKFKGYVGAHIIAQTAPICPSMLQHILARDAVGSLVEDLRLLPELEDMESDAPLCLDETRSVWLDATKIEDKPSTWDFCITSKDRDGAASNTTKHVSGRLTFQEPKDCVQAFEKYERLVDRGRALALLDGQEADQVIQGSRNIYKAFAGIVQYNDDNYRGLQKLASKNNESAGRIVKQDAKDSILGVGLGDTFCQVAGIFLNCMTDSEDDKMYLSNRVDQWIRSPNVPLDARPSQWEVYARHHQPSPKEYVSDLFVFDQDSDKLIWVILGLRFVEVPIAAMIRLLSRSPKATTTPVPSAQPVTTSPEDEVALAMPVETSKRVTPSKPRKKESNSKPPGRDADILVGVRKLFCNLLGLEPGDIQLTSDLVELGIDSLLAMEVAREVEKEFSIKFELEELMEMTDVRSLVNCIKANLGASDSSGPEVSGSEDFEMMSTGSAVQTPENDDSTKSFDAVSSRLDGNGSLTFPSESIIDAFTETRRLTDQFIEQSNLAGYSNNVQPRLTELVVVHTLDAFEQMGCPLRSAQSGETLQRISHPPKHTQVVKVLYGLLEKARLVDFNGSTITRTAVPTPRKSASKLLQELLRDYPEHAYDHKLTSLTGLRLADCLTGKAEAIQLIFGSAEGRELAAGMYGKSPINVAWLSQLQHFWKVLLDRLPDRQQEPINILEMGAGTGGTTAGLVSILAGSGIPFRYTATDISPSLVAGLRKRFKAYSWMRFEVLDVEKSPPSQLLESQHVVLATNCIHATHSLAVTTKNVHRILRPDGFLIMLEMTEAVPWVDSVFGLVEGWWLFNDGRQHALAQPRQWEETLRSNGYGHVDWTDGQLPENSIQRIIIALASGQPHNRVSLPPLPSPSPVTDFTARQAVIDSFVEKYTTDFAAPVAYPDIKTSSSRSRCILVTGATGSLGSHIVAHFAAQPDVCKVICLNRVSSSDANTRQLEALQRRGLVLEQDQLSKLQVIETDSSATMLGVSASNYENLVDNVTDVVHNAWPMSMTRPVRGFETQFKTMRNLINLCRECASRHRAGAAHQVGFQFVSSVSVVGCHPFLTGEALVPEQRVTVESTLPMGYADAKLVCERMVDETLHQYPDCFRVMAVRVGQISGSRQNGFWNPVEHLVHLIKSSHTLGIFPRLEGILSWCPVNDVAATLGELLLGEHPAYPIYHIENPIRQSWSEMTTVLCEILGIPPANVIPYSSWLHRVRQFPPSLASTENPAAGLVNFFETDFLRMSCGGMILDTTHSREHSPTLMGLGPIDRGLVERYIKEWRGIGFLR